MSDMAPQNYYEDLVHRIQSWEHPDADRVEFDEHGREWHR